MRSRLLSEFYVRQDNFRHFIRKCSIFHDTYVPNVVESNKYDSWSQNDFELSKKRDFTSKKCFSMIMPPPNVTGTLHLGHALTLTIQDTLIRWHKMHGHRTTWVPGMDHAGIATQVVVEKKIWQELRKTRHQLGRENLQKEILKWKEHKHKTVAEQIKQLGVLPDWNEEYFTLDEKRSEAVKEAFIRLFESGLIYRSGGIVNWSCALQSAISDIEVDHIQIKEPTLLKVPGYEKPIEFGRIFKFAYKFCDSNEEIIVATTRPETILGDVAVAVAPNDQRFSKFVGRYVRHPFSNRKIPVISDSAVDISFGTGAVKVSPSHDATDFQIAKRHALHNLEVINEKGVVVDGFDAFSGMKRFDARNAVVERLKSLCLLRNVENHEMNVPVCSRSSDVVEFVLKPQWFVDCKEMAEKARKCVENGSLVIEPQVFNKTWFQWLDNIRDWCVSRQLWWGHRIPIYSCRVLDDLSKTAWVAAHDHQEAITKAKNKLSVPESEIIAEQDLDVLDTWFSSALLPFSSFGWPKMEEHSPYPLSLMETGHDILFFWVARMTMLGLELTGRLPFQKILLHGIICDAQGRKMSKSLGNVVAPEDVISGRSLKELADAALESSKDGLLSREELDRAILNQKKMFPGGVPACGADALRFTLASHNVKSHFINFDVNECHTNKLFCNKIWQAVKFTRLAQQKISRNQQISEVHNRECFSLMDRWILSKLYQMTESVDESIKKFDFHVATFAIKQFLYSEFCDVFIETAKPGLAKPSSVQALGHLQVLVLCLDVGLKCLHPFMPFLTEELYKHLPRHPVVKEYYSGIQESAFPHVDNFRDVLLEDQVELVLEAVASIRKLKKLYCPSKLQPKVDIVTADQIFQDFSAVISSLTASKNLVITEKVVDQNKFVSDTIRNRATVYLEVPGNAGKLSNFHVDKKLGKIISELEKLKKMTCAENYKINAPLHVQQKHSARMSSLETELQRLKEIQQNI